MLCLGAHEQAIVDVVRDLVDRDVKPTVQQTEHANIAQDRSGRDTGAPRHERPARREGPGFRPRARCFRSSATGGSNAARSLAASEAPS